MVFQSFALYPHLTVYENFAYPLREAKVESSEIDKRAKETAEMLKLSHRLERKPNTLSGGEQQRVALARAAAPRPAILLADEPTGNLDGETGRRILDLLFALRDRHGATLVLVTHASDLAARCDRVVRLADGRVLGAGAPA